jgi:hypothetical protein
MREKKHVNLHPKAIRLREDLKGVFSSFKEITLCGLTENFVNFLQAKGQPIKFVTVYKYLTETTPPAWLFPYLFEFLSQKPYSESPLVWTFLQVWGRPINLSLERIREQAEKRRQALMNEADKLKKFT